MKYLFFCIVSIFIAFPCLSQEVTVGESSQSWNYPFHNSYFDCRTQTIYHSDEINTSGYISGISYNLCNSTKDITDFKIRIKETNLDCYSDAVFDSDGWTVVYDGNWPMGSGWIGVDFECPYYYSGQKNLIIDVSFNRSKYNGSSFYCYVEDLGLVRTLYAGVNDLSDLDPQIWNTDHACGPTAKTSTNMPAVKLKFQKYSAWQHLGVMTFNIRGGGNNETSSYNNYVSVPAGSTPRRERMIEMINSASQSFGDDGPDIIGFQEVNNNNRYLIDGELKTNLVDLIHSLDDRYSWSGISDQGYVVDYHSDAYNTIFFKKERFNCKDSGTFWLSETPDEVSIYSGAKFNRVASWIILYDVRTNLDYFVLNTHFSHVSDEARGYASQVIMDKISTLIDPGQYPIIVMGDMNSTADDTPYKVFTAQQYQNEICLRDFFREIYPIEQTVERTTSSYTGLYEGNRIDYIFGYGSFICSGVSIERGTLGSPELYPSDHYPVAAHLYFPRYNKADLNSDNSVDINDMSDFCQNWLAKGQTLSCSTINDGLIARWSFDDTQSSGKLTDGVIGNACNFDGIDEAIISSVNYSGGSEYEQVLDEWTVAFWCKMDRFPEMTPVASYMMNIIGDENKYPGSVQICVRYDNTIRVEIYNSSDRETAYTTDMFVTNRWYHVAVVYSTSPNEVKFYIDGKLDSKVSLSQMTSCWFGPLAIGKYSTSRYLDGAIDELRIYDRQITESEISYLAAGADTNGDIYIGPDVSADIVKDDDNVVNLLDWAEFSFWYGQ